MSDLQFTLVFIISIYLIISVIEFIRRSVRFIRLKEIDDSLHRYYKRDNYLRCNAVEFTYKDKPIKLFVKREDVLKEISSCHMLQINTLYINDIPAFCIFVDDKAFHSSRRIYWNKAYDNKEVFKILSAYDKIYYKQFECIRPEIKNYI